MLERFQLNPYSTIQHIYRNVSKNTVLQYLLFIFAYIILTWCRNCITVIKRSIALSHCTIDILISLYLMNEIEKILNKFQKSELTGSFHFERNFVRTYVFHIKKNIYLWWISIEIAVQERIWIMFSCNGYFRIYTLDVP